MFGQEAAQGALSHISGVTNMRRRGGIFLSYVSQTGKREDDDGEEEKIRIPPRTVIGEERQTKE